MVCLGGKRTGIGILKVGLVFGKARVDDGHQALVKVLSLVEVLEILGRVEVGAGADFGIGAARAALQPSLALGLVDGGSVRDAIDGDILVVVEGPVNLGSVGERLGGRARVA